MTATMIANEEYGAGMPPLPRDTLPLALFNTRLFYFTLQDIDTAKL